MGHNDTVAHDPSASSGHLPGFAREEQDASRQNREMTTNPTGSRSLKDW